MGAENRRLIAGGNPMPAGSLLRRWQVPRDNGTMIMLRAAFFFAIIALVLGVLGFGGIAGFAWDIAKILFWLAVAIAVILFILGFTIYKKVSR